MKYSSIIGLALATTVCARCYIESDTVAGTLFKFGDVFSHKSELDSLEGEHDLHLFAVCESSGLITGIQFVLMSSTDIEVPLFPVG